MKWRNNSRNEAGRSLTNGAKGLARAIKANGLKIFVGVNPTFFSVNTDLDPDIVANAQPDSALFFFPYELSATWKYRKNTPAKGQSPGKWRYRKLALRQGRMPVRRIIRI